MITDKLENAPIYYGLGERFKKAFEYLMDTDFETIEPGKYELDGAALKVAVQEYETKPESECKIEAHKKYADIQYIVSGEEIIGMDTLRDQESIAGYNEEKDVWHFSAYDYKIRLTAGMFSVFLPEDIHMPCLISNEKTTVKKVVVKVLL